MRPNGERADPDFQAKHIINSAGKAVYSGCFCVPGGSLALTEGHPCTLQWTRGVFLFSAEMEGLFVEPEQLHMWLYFTEI